MKKPPCREDWYSII